MRITKEVEFDYGHRVPSHKSKCRNLHGHRGKVQATLEGDIKTIRGESDDGMVIDFSDIKLALTSICDNLDHAFIVYDKDFPVVGFLQSMPDHKTIYTNFIPTAENLSQWVFNSLHFMIDAVYQGDLTLVNVRFYETPTSFCDATSYQDGFKSSHVYPVVPV